ncbi:putative nuclease HARBI1 [Metopolophium dirhodum]|uniref:putative nuclease HARBI1 n=1 Tax=Metopolophium dirhodum TaxID=44670 RepID=UPI00298F6F30|nr:putative nuclease HARBI1 [Metopolophium dirhodum]
MEVSLSVPKKKAEWEIITNGFNTKWNFPQCIGAIDGKHIVIKAPKHSGSLYFNYKNQFSIVLLALVDHDYNFTCIDIGSYGSASDGGIFGKSALNTAIIQNQLDLPENSVIPLKEYLMKLFPRRPNQHIKERVYNYRHCRARRISENAFGILTNRFRIFSRTIDLEPNKIVKIVKACCTLHNWIRKKNKSNYGITTDIEDVVNSTVNLGSWREDPAPGGIINLAATRDRHFNDAARLKRTQFANYFMGEGEVEWQYRMVNMQVV